MNANSQATFFHKNSKVNKSNSRPFKFKYLLFLVYLFIQIFIFSKLHINNKNMETKLSKNKIDYNFTGLRSKFLKLLIYREKEAFSIINFVPPTR